MLADLVITSSPAAGRRRRWFAAGEARLAIDVPASDAPADDDGLSTLRDAVLLAEHDDLLRALAERCGEDLAWRPLAPPDPAADDACREGEFAFSIAQAGEPRRAAVCLPDDLHATLSRAVETFTDVDTDADRVRIIDHFPLVSLVIDRFVLSADDVARTKAGSLVLLPASFGSAWVAALRLVPPPPGDASPGGGGSVAMASECEDVPDSSLPVRLSLEEAPSLVPLAGRSEVTTKRAGAESRMPDGRDEGAVTEGSSRCTVTVGGAFRVPLTRWVASAAGERSALAWEGLEGASFSVSIERGPIGEGRATDRFVGSGVRLHGGYGVLLAEADPDARADAGSDTP